MILKTRNLLSQGAPKTFLTSTEAAGTTIFRLANSAGIGSAWAVQIGATGHEQTEVLIISGTPSGTVGTTTSASLYEHPADTEVNFIKYNQVIFERSTTGTAGSATPITDGTVTYQADSPYTQFDDTTGATTYAYRARYQYPGGSTSQSDWITPDGASFYSLATLRERGREKLWDSNFIKDDKTVDNWINEMKEILVNGAIEANEDYALGTADYSFGTSGLGTITAGNFAAVRRFEVTYNGADYFLSTKSYINEFVPDQVFSSTNPYHHYLGDTVFRVQPAESGGSARLTYYQFGTVMVNDTDELPQPMRRFTKSFVDYIKLQAQFKDGKANQEQIDTFVANETNKFVKSLTPRDQSMQSSIQIVEPLTGESYI